MNPMLKNITSHQDPNIGTYVAIQGQSSQDMGFLKDLLGNTATLQPHIAYDSNSWGSICIEPRYVFTGDKDIIRMEKKTFEEYGKPHPWLDYVGKKIKALSKNESIDGKLVDIRNKQLWIEQPSNGMSKGVIVNPYSLDVKILSVESINHET